MRLPQAGVPFRKSITRAEEKTALDILHFEHNEEAAKRIASFYDTPPLAYIHSYGCQQNVSTPALCGSTPSSGCSAMWGR